MTHVLVVDSNPAAQNDVNRAMGLPPVGENYAAVLRALAPALRVTITAPYDGPGADPHGFDGVVFTGSSVDWTTDAPEAAPLAAVMRAAFAAGRPVLGSCNGLQLAASVLGGSSAPSPNGREDGLARDIHLTEAGRAHPMMAGRRDGFAAPCIHRDEVRRLPRGAVRLAGNAHSPVQAFAYAQDGVDFWGVQYHPEYTLDYVATCLSHMPDLTPAERRAKTHGLLDPDARVTELRNWLHHIGASASGGPD